MYRTRIGVIVSLLSLLLVLLIAQYSMQDKIVPSEARRETVTYDGTGNMTSGFMGQVLVELNQRGGEVPEDISTKIEAAKLRNSDVVGWIAVDEFNIDYPVLYSENNKEYLRKDIDGNYDVAGCIYLDANYGNIYSPIKLIHGHNMRNGTMFANVPQMLYWDTLDDAPSISYYDELGMKVFKIFSVFSVDSTKESVIVSDVSTFDELLQKKVNYVERSWVPIEEVPDSLEMLMLNTCWYGESGSERNLHCIVVAARVS